MPTHTTIIKMTPLSAQRLVDVAPMMPIKGRIQPVADAYITISNPTPIIEKATSENGLEFLGGVEYVMVNGMFVLENGKKVNNLFPGQAVYGKFKK